MNRSQKARYIAASILFACIALAAFAVWRSSASLRDRNQLNDSADNKAKLHARIRDGFGREVQFSLDGSPGRIRDSVNSFERFIFKRSGLKLSARVKTKLADMEARTLNGSSRRISVSELDEILSEVAIHRLAALTDEDIKHTDETLRGFQTDDMPDQTWNRSALKLPGRLLIVSSEKFIERMKSLREKSTSADSEAMKGVIRSFVDNSLRESASRLSEALPEQFGGVWDSTNNRDGAGLTPLQALTLTYSFASGDLLCDSDENLHKYMSGLQRAITKLRGQPHPMPEGHLAFGPNGYITSAPLDVVFDDDTFSFLLDRIRERSGR